MTPVNQVDQFLDQAPSLPIAEQNPNGIQTPFPTSYILTREQEDNLVETVIRRTEQIELEMGRNVSPSSGSLPSPDANTHLGKREIYTLRYQNYVEDRKTGAPPSNPKEIYDVSNLTAALSQRATMQMAAEANNYFLGTDPWFQIGFVGREDEELARQVDRHAHWKLGMSGLRGTIKEANEYAFVRGESVLKTTYVDRVQYYKKKGEALHDENGNPVIDSNGNHVFGDAQWIDEMAPAEPTLEEVANGINPEPTPTGRKVLRRDGKTVLPAAPQWLDGVWPMRRKIYSGPECSLVYYKDFLCPLEAKDIHTADLIAHVYDLPVMDLVEMFRRQDLRDMGAQDSAESLRKAVELLRNLSGEGGMPKAAALQARPEQGEQGITGDDSNPTAEVIEAYVRGDFDGDGLQEEVMVVVDRKNRFPIFYDYTANVTVTGRRPFEVIRAKPVDGRWYGMGGMEYFAPEQEFIDLQINRKNFRQSGAGRVTFWNPWNTKEGQSQPGLKLHHGKTYTLQEGKKAEETLSYVTLPGDDDNLMELINFFMQIMQLKSGVMNGGDQRMAGLPTSRTATGVNEVSNSGQKLFSTFLDSLEAGNAAAVKANVYVMYGNLDEREYFRYKADGKGIIGSLDPEDVADLEYDITLLMTQRKSEQIVQQNTQALDVALKYYAQPPVVQSRITKLAVDLLKGFQIDDAHEIIIPIDPSELPPPAAAAGGAPGQNAPLI